ncbi:MAG TPA: pyridoxine 5'-phosphate synthase, partial [Candidatus Brocadiales bacterium]|nr:pyridoxine 5'-phosphate synthase [Candidatus Brocadiales bacterium]
MSEMVGVDKIAVHTPYGNTGWPWGHIFKLKNLPTFCISAIIHRNRGDEMARLGVNIDHVATLRQSRGGNEPEPIAAAVIAEMAGADGIVVHLREDRRHIQDRDLRILREIVQTKLDLEMAATDEMVKIALEVKPDMVTIVPERREELTTEGGLDISSIRGKLKDIIELLHEGGIIVSL